MRKLLTILIIFGIFILATGCTQKSKDNNSQEYSGKAISIKHTTVEINEINSGEQFKNKLKEFYDFSQKFFAVWNIHVESTTLPLEKFNSKNTSLADKITYSRIIREKYEKLNESLKQITPPAEASEAYNLILNAISKRILFFNEFEKGTNIHELIAIENEAYLYENLFWTEIDKIFDGYLKAIDKKNNLEV